jgi:hypothetical protein
MQAMECTTRNTEAAARSIVRRDPGAVIVLASDHGSDVDVPGDRPEQQWSQQVVTRRFSNFAALRLPRRCRAQVPDRLAEVNIMRVVMNCLTDPDLPLLAGRRYFSDVALDVQRDHSFKP